MSEDSQLPLPDAAAWHRGAEQPALEKTGNLESSQPPHEFNIHHIELELQNHALLEIRNQLEKSLENYIDLYEFSPVGYFTLAADGMIEALNSTGAALLGQERALLIHQHFDAFVSMESRPAFNVFLEQVSLGVSMHVCEILLAAGEAPTRHLRLEGIAVTTPNLLCRIAAIDISALKKTEAALRQSELKYRALYESMRDAFVSVDMSGRILDCNAVYQEMLGYSAAEIFKLTYQELTPKKWHGYESRIVQEQILRRGYSDVYEKEYRKKDGTVFPIEIRTSLVRDETGQPQFMWAVIRDITQRKQAEKTLRLNQMMLAAGARLTCLGSWMWDIERDVFIFSDEWRHIHGCQAPTLSIAELLTIAHPDDLPMIQRAFDQAIQHGKPYALEHRIVRQDNQEIRHIAAYGEVVLDEAGRPVKIIGAAQDITERKQADEALKVALVKYKTLFDNFPLGIVILDPAGQIVESNSVSEQLLGLQKPEYCRRRIDSEEWRVVGPDGTLMPFEEYACVQALKKKCLVKDVEIGVIKESNEIAWINVTAAPLSLAEYGAVVAYADITERKKLQAELERQARTDYLTGLANRRYFVKQGEIEFARALRYGHSLSILLLDVDSFKNVNDAYGHQTGDSVLQQIGQALLENLRETDFPSRWGGEEFAVWLPVTAQENAVEVAERIRKSVADVSVILDGLTPFQVTLSIGVATLKSQDTNIEELFKRVDDALYRAKGSGRNKVCVAT